MSAISQVFQYESESIRTVLIDTEEWVVGKDVCTAIGISKYRDAIAQLDEDERVSAAVDTPGGRQEMSLVNESGIFALLLIAAIEEGHRELTARMDGIEGRHDWFSALGYARLNNLSTEAGYLRRLGETATAITRGLGFEPAKTQHDRFEEVNSYPVEALRTPAEVAGKK